MGKDLYEVDTDATGVAAPVKKAETTAPMKTEPFTANTTTTSTTTTTADDHAHGKRKPLIKFLGKRSLLKNDHKAPAGKPTTGASPKPQKPQTGVAFTTLKAGAFYGRPALSQREIDAIETGGAM